ncbi:MAG: peptide chain release factor 2 [Candidatus Pacebacteria bacterium]|nr:peptide chain release factor 2 [Candidatus Paceibacterota bacterium]
MTEKELKNGIEELIISLDKLGKNLFIENKKNKLFKIEEELQNPDIWKDREKAENISKEAAELEETIKDFEDLKKTMPLFLKNPNEEDFFELKRKFKKLEIKTFFRSSYDKGNAIFSIFSGAGGQDAADFSGMLFEMYAGYAKKKGFSLSIIDESLDDFQSKTGRKPLKSLTAEIRGNYAYGFLKGEAGVHRLVRISPFSPKKLRHTSFALVEILPVFPKIEEEKIKIPEEDLKIDLFRSSGPGGQNVNKVETAVRITHLPTGIMVSSQAERSQTQNREKALSLLKTKLIHLMEEKQVKEITELRTKEKPEWGSQIRSYVLHPYKLIKDHRTEFETSQVENVLEGNLDGFIEAELINGINNHK